MAAFCALTYQPSTYPRTITKIIRKIPNKLLIIASQLHLRCNLTRNVVKSESEIICCGGSVGELVTLVSVQTYSSVRSPSSPCSAGASAGPRASRAVSSRPGSCLRHRAWYRSARSSHHRLSAATTLPRTTLTTHHCTATLLPNNFITNYLFF